MKRPLAARLTERVIPSLGVTSFQSIAYKRNPSTETSCYRSTRIIPRPGAHYMVRLIPPGAYLRAMAGLSRSHAVEPAKWLITCWLRTRFLLNYCEDLRHQSVSASVLPLHLLPLG